MHVSSVYLVAEACRCKEQGGVSEHMIETLLTSVNGTPNATALLSSSAVHTGMVSLKVREATETEACANARVALVLVTAWLAIAENDADGDMIGGGRRDDNIGILSCRSKSFGGFDVLMLSVQGCVLQ